MNSLLPIEGLPAADLMTSGLRDIFADKLSIGSLLVRICWSRLQWSGVLPADAVKPAPLGRDAEHVLYEMLCLQHGREAYSEYRALIRQLTSFNNAADQRRRALPA